MWKRKYFTGFEGRKVDERTDVATWIPWLDCHEAE